MKLSPEQILDIVHNTLFTSVTPDAEVQFYRFSATQQAAYAARKSSFGEKCYASASVMLDFVTDSQALSLAAKFEVGSSNKIWAIDLMIDGVLCQHTSGEGWGDFEFSFALPEGVKRVTVVFPWSVRTTLKNIEISDDAFILPLEKQLRILSIGDSITQGYFADHPCATYVTRTALELNAEVLNQGIGGYQFFEESLDGELCWQPDIITLAYGTNDYSHNDSFDIFKKQVETYVAKLVKLYPDTPILGITPIYRDEAKLIEKAAKKGYTFFEAVDYIKSVYAKYDQITVLDGLSFFPHPAEFFKPDWLHPNDLGFSYYADALQKAIKEMVD